MNVVIGETEEAAAEWKLTIENNRMIYHIHTFIFLGGKNQKVDALSGEMF